MGDANSGRRRLTTLKPSIGKLPSSAVLMPATEQERDKFRYRAVPWRKWYSLKRWKQLRARVLLRDLFTCQMCKRMTSNQSLLIADHKEPHRGDELLFWDEANVWCICKPCHDSAKQREEAGR